MGRYLALLDGSIYARSVCEMTAWVALRAPGPVDLLHVLGRRDVSSAPLDLSGNLDVDSRETLLAELAALDADRAKLAQRRGRLLLDQGRALVEAAGVTDVATRLRHGDLLETVQEMEAGCELIVIGKRGEAADFARLHLGSNLERVVRASRRPVLVAARAFRPIRRVLVAYDGGSSAMKAVDHIARSPLFAGLDVTLLTIGTDTPQAERAIEDAARLLRGGGHAPQCRIEPGHAETAIARHVEVEGMDLLVMGAYGHSRIRALMIGSTTTEMIRSCKVPVMLFR